MNRPTLKPAIIEPWFGESHAALFSGVAEHSRFDCTLITLPARKWQWRMRLGAYHLKSQLQTLATKPDVLLVSDYTHLPLLKTFTPKLRDTPTAVYFLENQLTYPVRGENLSSSHEKNFEFMAINITTCLAAEAAVFCSEQHRDAMLDAIPAFLAHDPGPVADDIVQQIEQKSEVIPIGVNLALFDDARKRRNSRKGQPLRVVWPHRFEHDKNPDALFEVLSALDKEGLPFELAMLGRTYRDLPLSLQQLKMTLSHHVVTWDFLEGQAYADALAASDVVLSTAWQETQGIAVIEAIRAGCDPLLPARLSYPEILGPNLCPKHLYNSTGDLRRRLRWMMRHPDRVRNSANHFAEMNRFAWNTVSGQFDALFYKLAQEEK